MAEIDLFKAYARTRLDEWGHEFAFHRDQERLGLKSKDMLQVLIEHKGEMPPRAIGFKPVEVSLSALQIEDIVRDIAKSSMSIACALRAYHCGSGRRAVERYELYRAMVGLHAGRRVYFAHVRAGEDEVAWRLQQFARAA